jgi:predicted dehydrogenase
MAELRLGIIGAGALSSKRIYPCLHYLPVQLAAVCDLDRAKAEKNARKFGGQAVYTDHRQMFREVNLDGVVVCVGPEAHHQLAIEAMEAGLPVYTEKPPAVTPDAARSVLEASQRTGQICMTGFKKRFAPAYLKAQQAVTSPEFGAPSLLSIDYCSGHYSNDPENPRRQFLLDFCVHIIDLSRFLFGEVVEVFARTQDQISYAVNLQFANGAIGVLALSCHRDWRVSTEKVELTGGPGQFISLNNSIQMVRYAGDTIMDWHDPSFSTAGGDSLIETGFERELEEFVTAIQQQRQPESSIASSYRTMLLYEAIRQSAGERRTVALDEVEMEPGLAL